MRRLDQACRRNRLGIEREQLPRFQDGNLGEKSTTAQTGGFASHVLIPWCVQPIMVASQQRCRHEQTRSRRDVPWPIVADLMGIISRTANPWRKCSGNKTDRLRKNKLFEHFLGK